MLSALSSVEETTLFGYLITISSFNLMLVLFTLLQELISIKSFNIYSIVFTLKARYDLNYVKSAVKL